MRKLIAIILCALALAAAAAPAQELQRVWSSATFDGVDYVNMREVCKRYGYSALPMHRGMLSYGKANSDRSTPLKRSYRIFLRPNKQDFYVEHYRFVLTHAAREANGHVYISAVDFEKLVDPVLNPKLSKSKNFNTVVLDPGHGGHDHGATSPYAREKDCNLALAQKVRAKLMAKGFRVVMTRNSDYFLTLGERVAIANRVPNAIFVSIHHNSTRGNTAAQGIETFTLAPHGTTSPFARTRRTENLSGNDQDSENIALAAAVHSHVINGLAQSKQPTPDRGIQRARFSVLCTIRCPAILFEAGFVSNPSEGAKIASSSYQELLAEYICRGIVRYQETAAGNASPRRTGSGTSQGIRPGSSPRKS